MKTSSNHILVPIDFSEQSLIALTQSFNLARYHQSDITLINVIDIDFLQKLTGFFKGDDANENLYKAEIEEKLKNLADQMTIQSGLRIKTMVRTGKIYEELVQVAKDLDAVLIVMGTSGGSDSIKKKFVGSNAVRVINEAQCPVISIHGKLHRQGCKNIVLPLDLSIESRDKVNKAIEIAKYFGSKINIIALYNSSDDFLRNKLTLQMNSVQQFIVDEGIETSAELLLSKDASDTVIDYSKKIDADLIVIISQSDSEFTGRFLGTEAHDIINNSPIPVLSVRANERKDLYEYVLS
jgi:nucleotide-binding universal stress UspA family protein